MNYKEFLNEIYPLVTPIEKDSVIIAIPDMRTLLDLLDTVAPNISVLQFERVKMLVESRNIDLKTYKASIMIDCMSLRDLYTVLYNMDLLND